LTWLENNGWVWELAGVRVLVDPWLVGELDFDIPAFYSAKKRVTGNMTVDSLPPLDAVLITQSLDDHCHLKTLRAVAERRPDIRVIAPPSAQSKLEPLFKNLTLIEHGQTVAIAGPEGARIMVRATPGDRVGPPWQARENGYVVSSTGPAFSLYYEPHCKFEDISKDEKVDCVITPTVSQKILGYELVSGEERAVQLARQLKAKYIVPMLNGDLEATGLLARVVKTGGTAESFQKIASPEFMVLTPKPGEALAVPPTP
jgi:L-ascorbate metabolism protein UlaG (beta-lactamase superfamily)